MNVKVEAQSKALEYELPNPSGGCTPLSGSARMRPNRG